MRSLQGSFEMLGTQKERTYKYARSDNIWHSRVASAKIDLARRTGADAQFLGGILHTYSYACTACAHRFDIHQEFTDDALTVCSVCEGRLRKVFGSIGVTFKGSGFYRTDHGPGARANAKRDNSGDSSKSSKAGESASGGASASSDASASSGASASGGSSGAGSNSGTSKGAGSGSKSTSTQSA